MKYRATCSFSGPVSMVEGQIREINDKTLVKELMRVKYIEKFKEEASAKEAKKRKKEVKQDESDS